MKNTIINYSKVKHIEESSNVLVDDIEYIVSDYFSKKISLSDIMPLLEPMLQYYSLYNNDKLERVSYELYKSTDYWDLILLLNKADPLFGIPYDTEVLEKNASSVLTKYESTYSKFALGDRKEPLFDELVNIEEIKNEEYRVIKVPKPERLNDIVAILKKQGCL